MQENMYGATQAQWLQMTEGDRAQWNQIMAASGAQPSPMVNPTTLPDYRPDMMYDNYGTIAYAYGPGGGSSGVSSSGMGTVGPPNSGGGAGAVGSGYGYAQPGPGLSPLAPGTGQGQGIYDDAAMYRGGDFQGGGSDPYAGTQYAGGGDGSAPLYSGGGIGSDYGASRAERAWQEAMGQGHFDGELGWVDGPGWYTDLGLPVGANGYGQPSPAFDYNSMNMPSFNGNWGDAAYAFNPWAGMNDWGGIPDTTGGQGFSPGKDQSQPPQNLYQPDPSWMPGARWEYRGPGADPFANRGGSGGIGSDALRDQFAWTLAQSSPYAENANIPSRPTANQGYNPGMENWFANPGMNTFDPNSYQQQLQDILKGIDQGTGQQNLDPNWFAPGANGPGGRSYYQGDNNTQLITSGG